MQVTQMLIAFVSMLIVVVTLERAAKWMKDLKEVKAEIDKRHDHGV